MTEYLAQLRKLLSSFAKYEIRQIPRLQNANTDSLARLAATYEMELSWTVLVEILEVPSILRAKVMKLGESSKALKRTWMDSLIDFIVKEELLLIR